MVSYEVGESFHVGAYLPCRTLGINVVFKIKKKTPIKNPNLNTSQENKQSFKNQCFGIFFTKHMDNTF